MNLDSKSVRELIEYASGNEHKVCIYKDFFCVNIPLSNNFVQCFISSDGEPEIYKFSFLECSAGTTISLEEFKDIFR